MFCSLPYQFLEVRSNGDVHCCCWISTPIGNIFKTRITDLWHGPLMQEIRESVTDGDFRYCARCPYRTAGNGPVGPTPQTLPDTSQISSLWLSHDKTCNLSCPSCRPQVLAGAELESQETNVVHKHLLESSVLSLAGEITVAGYGEALASPLYRSIIKMLPSLAPRARLHLFTNGQLLDEECWQELDLQRLSILDISIDAATRTTYELNRRGGSWSKLWDNVELVRAKKREKPFQLRSNYVVQQNNFRELAPFVAMAFEHDFNSVGANFIDDWKSLDRDDYLARAAHLPGHPEHARLRAAMQDPLLRDPRVLLPSLPALR